jgi:hypothetical protein
MMVMAQETYLWGRIGTVGLVGLRNPTRRDPNMLLPRLSSCWTYDSVSDDYRKTIGRLDIHRWNV